VLTNEQTMANIETRDEASMSVQLLAEEINELKKGLEAAKAEAKQAKADAKQAKADRDFAEALRRRSRENLESMFRLQAAATSEADELEEKLRAAKAEAKQAKAEAKQAKAEVELLLEFVGTAVGTAATSEAEELEEKLRAAKAEVEQAKAESHGN
jgi:hypothetical protein